MISTLLLTPPLNPWERMGSLSEGGAIMPGLGLLSLAACLRRDNWPVRILDAEGQGWGLEETIRVIEALEPDILGITTTTLSVFSAAAVAVALKERLPGVKVVLGGPHVTALPQQTMEQFPQIDGCILGDGEESIVKLVENIANGLEPEQGLDGAIWRRNGQVVHYPKTRHLSDLDSLPFPAWDLLEAFPGRYRPPFHSYRRQPLANILTARGCPGLCTFCDRAVFGRRPFFHSIEYVVEMIEYLMKDFGIREISIKDDMFVTRKERVFDFCRLVKQRGLDITWSCNARVNYVSDEMLKEMKNAGCWLVSYGIESGSPKMLNKMHKGITKDQVLSALQATRKNGLVSKGFFMIGIPGETIETMEETLRFIRKLPLDELNINAFTPFPGSELYNETLAEGFQPDFKRMNMIDVVYVPQGLTAQYLRDYQKKVIRSFYFRPSKMALYASRALTDLGEFKRLWRMSKMFLAMNLKTRK